MTADNQRCPQCQGLLPPGRTEGLCPKCLLQQGLQTSPATVAPTQSSARAQGGLPAFVAATPAELANYFPQLEILELIGAGGMGAVYKARQASLDRIVALKVLPREVGQDPAFAERFTREAKALARLNHPHIVTIHDIGQAGGLYYIVMEYIDGANLREMINTQSLSPQQTLALVPQLCEALQYAHDEGIVHRDIKPENILVDKRGRAKVADFGLAKMLGEQLLQTSLTATQQVMGTLRYMAPEQMLGAKDIDHRADLYALGVVFYELLTGDLPLGRFPLPSEKAACDARLDEVVLKALERERERRYQQASELQSDVETISGSYAAKPSAPVAVAPPTPTPMGAEAFENAADEVRGPAWGLIIVGVVQVLFVLVIASTVFSIDSVWGPDRQTGYSRVHAQPTYLLVWLMLSLPFSLILVAAAIQMNRLRSYDFAVIASVLAILPVGPTCIFSLPVGLWSLLVLLRPQVRAAFRTPPRERPEAWQSRDAELLLAKDRDPAAYQRAYGRVQSRCRVVGILMIVCSGLDALAALMVSFVVTTQSRGFDPMPALVLIGIPLSTACAVLWGAWCLMRLRGYKKAVVGAILCVLPLTPLFWLRWMIGAYGLATLMRSDVRLAFQLKQDGRAPGDDTPPNKPGGSSPGGVYAYGKSELADDHSPITQFQSWRWNTRDEAVLLAGVVGGLLMVFAPLAPAMRNGWLGFGMVVVGTVTLVLSGGYHVARGAARSQGRQLADESVPTWGQWWRDSSLWFRRATSTTAMIAYLVCLVLFLSLEVNTTDNIAKGLQPGSREVAVGTPTPWLLIERKATADSLRYGTSVDLLSWSVFYGVAAVALIEVVAITRLWEVGTWKAARIAANVLSGIAVAMVALLAVIVGFSA